MSIIKVIRNGQGEYSTIRITVVVLPDLAREVTVILFSPGFNGIRKKKVPTFSNATKGPFTNRDASVSVRPPAGTVSSFIFTLSVRVENYKWGGPVSTRYW